MKIYIKGLLIVFFILCLPFSATGTLATYPDLDKDKQITPNGFFEVYLKDAKGWNLAGRIGFDKYLREKTLQLGDNASTIPGIEVQIIQTGGQAAHIDAVFLNGRPPVSAKEKGSPVDIQKISQTDFDLIDGFGKTFSLSFSDTDSDGVLSIIARIEAERISETPFHFPLTNLYRKITPGSDFYSYDLSRSVSGNPLASKPFFREWSQSGSGHPSTYTYGWVWHDLENLYVYMDLAGDNTCDGLKDYAKVYVNTDGKIRMFKMSMGDTQWGNPEFKYTDAVAYQHKVYPFTIPLSEIGDPRPEKLDLAFAAYGTLAPAGVEFFYEILMNTGPGGGPVNVEQLGETATINDINYIVRAWTAHYPGPEGLVRLQLTETLEWQDTDFRSIADDLTYYDITGNQGQGGTKAVEFCTDIANIRNFTGSFKGLFHASISLGPNDFTSGFIYSLDTLSIPTLTQWGMIILSLILISISFRALRRSRYRRAIYSVLLVFVFVVVAWAANISIDGDMSDWTGIDAIVTDPEGDSSAEDQIFIGPNEDIRYGYVTSDADKLYFRVDYTGALLEPPI